MRPVRIALIDDEPLARLGLAARLAAFAGFECVAEFGDGLSARAGLAAAQPDLLIVDVQMPGLSGLDLLASWAAPQRPLAILHTAHAEHALRAFELQVVDYLLKPLDETRLAEALGRARAVLRGRDQSPRESAAVRSTRFEVRVGSRLHYLSDDAVHWIEAARDYAQLHTDDGRCLLLREPLQSLAERLDPERFVRVHRSAIVRLDQVAEVQALSNRDAMLRLCDGTPVRASRSYVPLLMARLRATGLPTSRHG